MPVNLFYLLTVHFLMNIRMLLLIFLCEQRVLLFYIRPDKLIKERSKPFLYMQQFQRERRKEMSNLLCSLFGVLFWEWLCFSLGQLLLGLEMK